MCKFFDNILTPIFQEAMGNKSTIHFLTLKFSTLISKVLKHRLSSKQAVLKFSIIL